MSADHLVTQLLADVAAGKKGAEEQLVDAVYKELHRLAMLTGRHIGKQLRNQVISRHLDSR